MENQLIVSATSLHHHGHQDIGPIIGLLYWRAFSEGDRTTENLTAVAISSWLHSMRDKTLCSTKTSLLCVWKKVNLNTTNLRLQLRQELYLGLPTHRPRSILTSKHWIKPANFAFARHFSAPPPPKLQTQLINLPCEFCILKSNTSAAFHFWIHYGFTASAPE